MANLGESARPPDVADRQPEARRVRLASTASLSGRAAPHLGRARFDSSEVPALVFPGLRGDQIELVRLAISLVWLLLVVPLLLLTGEAEWLRYVVLAAFAIWAAVFWPIILWNFRHDISRIALTSHGVHGGTNSELFVPWDAIESVGRVGKLAFSNVRIVVSNTDGVREPNWYAVLRRLSRRFSRKAGAAEVNLFPQRRTSSVAVAIRHYSERPAEREAIGRELSDGLRVALTATARPVWLRLVMGLGWAVLFVFGVLFVALAAGSALSRLIGS